MEDGVIGVNGDHVIVKHLQRLVPVPVYTSMRENHVQRMNHMWT